MISARKQGDRDLSDERILGDAYFVDQVIKEADERLSSQLESLARKQRTQEIIQKICDQENINVLELKAGSRRILACRVRSQAAHELVLTYGIPLAEVAQHVGVAASAICKMLRT